MRVNQTCGKPRQSYCGSDFRIPYRAQTVKFIGEQSFMKKPPEGGLSNSRSDTNQAKRTVLPLRRYAM